MTAKMKDPVIEIDDKSYTMRLAKITNTMLGYEDHGIFTAQLTLDYGGSGQGAGGYSLDQPTADKGDREGTGYGLDHIIKMLRVVGVDTWEKMNGRDVYALIEESWGTVHGLANKFHPTQNYFIFKDHAEKWGEKKT